MSAKVAVFAEQGAWEMCTVVVYGVHLLTKCRTVTLYNDKSVVILKQIWLYMHEFQTF